MTKHTRDRSADLPLLESTPETWVDQVLSRPLILLNDHAHLEKKAANNALEMLLRWPEPNPPENWVQAMTAVARDEVEHLAIVTRILSRRGGRLTKGHSNPYANALAAQIRRGDGPRELVDRLMVSGLIEARSCERFEILSRMCADPELTKLYGDLWASEHGHFRTFLNLAEEVDHSPANSKRWSEWLQIEAHAIKSQASGPRMHSWPD